MIDDLRRPLREWLPLELGDLPRDLGGLIVLDQDDCLTPEAMEYGSDYTAAMFERHTDPLTLPAWTWQLTEQVERTVYKVLTSAGQSEYAATRRFHIEVPAGTHDYLRDEINRRGALRTGVLVDLAPDQVFDTEASIWYLPCPVCRWPMRVRGTVAQCPYPPHQVRAEILPAKDPATAPSVRSRTAIDILPAIDVQCVHPAVWRYITVPGRPEVDLVLQL